jgi:hypothetical protein
MKHQFNKQTLAILGMAAALGLAGCGNKAATSPDSTTSTLSESQDDKFSIKDSVITSSETTSPETTSPAETEIVRITETHADGTTNGEYANGSYYVGMNEPGHLTTQSDQSTQSTQSDHTDIEESDQQSDQHTDSAAQESEESQLESSQHSSSSHTGTTTHTSNTDESLSESLSDIPEESIQDAPQETLPDSNSLPIPSSVPTSTQSYDFTVNQSALSRMSESELTTYDVIVTFWCENPDLSEEYLTNMFSSEARFPSLTDFERTNFVKEITTTHPHLPEETVSLDDFWATH